MAELEGEVVAEVRRILKLCPGCGYCLTGNVSGVCPECGMKRPDR